MEFISFPCQHFFLSKKLICFFLQSITFLVFIQCYSFIIFSKFYHFQYFLINTLFTQLFFETLSAAVIFCAYAEHRLVSYFQFFTKFFYTPTPALVHCIILIFASALFRSWFSIRCPYFTLHFARELYSVCISFSKNFFFVRRQDR